MADFVISGQLDPRQLLEGLKQFETQAGQSGQRAGESLLRGVTSKVSTEIPSSLSKALKSAEGSAVSSGTAIGKSLSGGVSSQVSGTIPSALEKALGSASGAATSSGKQLGSNLTTGVTGAVSTAIPSALTKALSSGSSAATNSGKQLGGNLASGAEGALQSQLPAGIQKAVTAGASNVGNAGKQLGTTLASGTSNSLLSMLPPSFTKAVQAAGNSAQSSATSIGSGIGSGIGNGVSSTLPAQFKKVLAGTEDQAGQSGRLSGTAMGQGIGQGIDAQRALFASVVNQAQKAAKDVGIVFNTTKLQFEFPDGGLIPEAELNRLRDLNPLLNKAASDLSNLQAASGQGAAGIQSLGSSFTNATKNGQLMNGVIAGIAFSLTNQLIGAVGQAKAALQGMLGGFTQLDTEIRKAAAASEEVGGYERLQQVIDVVGIEAAGTQQAVAELATSLVRAGYSVSEVETALPGVVRGAEATGTAFENMGDIVGATLRGFQLETDQTSRVVDVLVKAANASNASVEGLGYTFEYAAPIAAALKISMEDLAATTGLMANAGIQASVAGTGLRTGLQRLQKAAAGAAGESLGLSKGQEKLSDAMRALGAEVTNANGELLPMDDVLKRLKASLEGFNTAEKIELVSAIFGDEAGSKFLAVLNQSTDSIDNMFNVIRNSSGATDVARDGMMGFQLALMQLEGSLGVIGNSIGKVISMALTPFVNAANLALGVLATLPAPVKTLAAALTLLVGAYAAAKVAAIAFSRAMKTEMVAAAVKEIQVLIRLLQVSWAKDVAAAKKMWADFTAAVMKQGWGQAAVAAIQQIVNGLKALNAQQAVQGFKNLGSAIVDASTKGGKGLVQLAQTGLAALQKGAGSAGAAALNLGASLAGMAGKSKAAEAGLTGAAKVLQQGMTAGANSAAKASSGLGSVLTNLSTLTGGQIVNGFKAAGTAIQAGAGKLGAWAASASIGGPVTLALAAAVTAATVAVVQYNNIMGKSRQVTEALQPSVDKLAKELEAAGIAYEDFGKQGGPVNEALTSVKRAFADAEENTKKFVAGLKGIPVVGGLVEAAANGMINALKWSGLGVTITGIKALVQTLGKLKDAYDESVKTAQTNQAIIEAGDQFEQLAEQVGKAVQSTDQYFQTLKKTETVNPAQLEAFTAVYEKQVGVLSKVVVATSEFGSSLRLLAQQEEAAGNGRLAEYYRTLAGNTDTLNKIATQRLEKLQEEAVRTGVVKDAALQLQYGLATLTLEYQKLSQEAAALRLDVTAGEQVVQYGQAILKLEESRFAIVKSRATYEMSELDKYWNARIKKAKDAGASDAQIRNLEKAALQEKEAKESQIFEQEKQAMNAKYQGLLQQQALETAIFQLKQQQRQVEADASVRQAEIAHLQAKSEYLEAEKAGNEKKKQDAAEALAKAEQELSVAVQQKQILDQSIPLETMIQNLTNETAQNMLQSEAAAKGIKLETSGAVQPTQAMQQAAAAAGYSFQQGANGAFTLVRNVTDAANASGQTATAAGQTATNMTQAGQAAGQAATNINQAATAADQTAQGAQDIQQGLNEAKTEAGNVAGQLDAAGQNAKNAAGEAGKIGQAAGNSSNAVKPLNQALGQAAGDAKVVATAEMAANLSRASGSAGGLRTAMQQAAAAAKDFYNWLAKSSGLPGSRWSGGPVEGGQQYRVNELGQEAFLSNSGRLSLINKPANALWRPPASGVVIPAGVTEGLKEKGVFSPAGQASGAVSGRRLVSPESRGNADQAAVMAKQAVAIGKLQQSVDRLVEKDWNVQVRVRNDAGGASHLNTLNRMR
jgi:TP901 family phage tail tape measure protein